MKAPLPLVIMIKEAEITSVHTIPKEYWPTVCHFVTQCSLLCIDVTHRWAFDTNN